MNYQYPQSQNPSMSLCFSQFSQIQEPNNMGQEKRMSIVANNMGIGARNGYQNYQSIPKNVPNYQNVQNNQNYQGTQNTQNYRVPQNVHNYQNFQVPQSVQGAQNIQSAQGAHNSQNFQGIQNIQSGQNVQSFQNPNGSNIWNTSSISNRMSRPPNRTFGISEEICEESLQHNLTSIVVEAQKYLEGVKVKPEILDDIEQQLRTHLHKLKLQKKKIKEAGEGFMQIVQYIEEENKISDFCFEENGNKTRNHGKESESERILENKSIKHSSFVKNVDGYQGKCYQNVNNDFMENHCDFDEQFLENDKNFDQQMF